VYSLAALSEWILVGLNVAFHATGISEWSSIRFIALETPDKSGKIEAV
jgi:hypothetical protein